MELQLESYARREMKSRRGKSRLVGRPALSDNSYVGGEYDIIYKRNKPRYKKGDVPVQEVGVRFIKNVEIVNGGIYPVGRIRHPSSTFPAGYQI
ncbi:MAG: hypothetical protein V8S96_04895 [Lachnospiraceae bacterium]